MGSSARQRRRTRVGQVALLVGAVSGCWVTLDPILDDAAGADAATSPPETCTVVAGESSEYLLCGDPNPFVDAAAACLSYGTELAAVNSDTENELLAVESYGPIGTNLWLGGSRDDDLVWRWQDGSVFWRGGRDGAVEPGAYAKWADGEPNNSSTVVDESERCLALTLGGNDWNDRACSIELPFACERPVAGAP